MLDRLEEIAKRHEDLLTQQADPEIAVDPNRSREVAKKLAELGPVVAVYRDYSSTASELEGAREIVAEADDDEMRQMAEAEVEELTTRLAFRSPRACAQRSWECAGGSATPDRESV